MSKIQDALNKIQDERGGTVVTESSNGSQLAEAAPLREDRHPTIALRQHNAIQVNRQSLRDAGLIAPEYDQRLLADQFREIKRPLIAHAFGKRATQVPDGNLMMISSALAGEGKTFTSINLALSMAQEQDYSVLLVDADVVNPRVSEVFGAPDAPGLLDVLDNRALDPESVILPTDVERLSIMTAGKSRPNATELLASSRMDEVAMVLRSSTTGRIVLFDSPPLLLTSESKILASIAGQIIVVVRAEETEHNVVLNAIDTLGEDKAVSLVLNQARAAGQWQVYGYSSASAVRYESDKST